MMKTKQAKTINLKPIEIDLHLRYECPSTSCKYDHWLSLKEAQTPNFKIVCDCGLVLRPKLVKTIKIIYKQKKIAQDTPVVKAPETPKFTQSIPKELQSQCSKYLMTYGFTKEESDALLVKAYHINQTINASALIKYILENIKTLETSL